MSAILFVLAYLNPNHFLPWTGFQQEYLAAFALVVLLVSIRLDLHLNLISLGFLIAVVSIALQWLLGAFLFRQDALLPSVYLLSLFAAYQTGYAYSDRKLLIESIAWVFLIAAGVNAVCGLMQWLNLESALVFKSGDVGGNLAQRNHHATLLVFGLLSALLLADKRQLPPIAAGLIGLVLIFVLAATQSRTPVLIMGFLAGWALVFSKHWRLDLKVWVFSAVVLYGLAYTLFPTIDAAWELMAAGENRLVSGSYSNRLEIWKLLLRSVLDGPWYGWGWGQVSVAQFETITPQSGQVEWVEYSHNIVLDLLIWAGPFFGGVILALLALQYCTLLKRATTGPDASWVLGIISALLIHSLVEYPHAYLYFTIPAFILIGVVMRGDGPDPEGPAEPSRHGYIAFAGGLMLLMVIARDYWIVEWQHRSMRAKNFGLQIDPAQFDKDVLILSGEKSFIDFAVRDIADFTPQQIETGANVVARYSLGVALFKYAQVLEHNGRRDEACAYLKKIGPLWGEDFYQYYATAVPACLASPGGGAAEW